MKNKTYTIEKSPFYNLKSRKKLLEILKINSYQELKTLSINSANYNVYYVENKNKPQKRIIEEPEENLKKVHKHFNKILQRIEVPEFVKAGRKNCSYIDNGKAHLQGSYFYCTDIKQFFPNTKKEKLLQFLLYDLKIAPDIAQILSTLLTYNNHLPTGSPSSQLLTFWSYRNLMCKIYAVAIKNKINMTLFVDDLTFSSLKPISRTFISFVEKSIQQEGLIMNKDKSKIYKKNAYKKVTGTIISPNNDLLIPNKLQHKIYMLKNKPNKTNGEIESLKGMLNSARRIKPNFMQNYYRELCKINND